MKILKNTPFIILLAAFISGSAASAPVSAQSLRPEYIPIEDYDQNTRLGKTERLEEENAGQQKTEQANREQFLFEQILPGQFLQERFPEHVSSWSAAGGLFDIEENAPAETRQSVTACHTRHLPEPEIPSRQQSENTAGKTSGKTRTDASGNTPSGPQNQKQPTQKQLSREEIESQKIAFFTKELELTPEEARIFWPLYYQSWEERSLARRETINNLRKLNQALKANPPKPESEIQRLADQYLASYNKECTMVPKYWEEFGKVLPLRKAAKIFHAEEDFRMFLIRQLKNN